MKISKNKKQTIFRVPYIFHCNLFVNIFVIFTFNFINYELHASNNKQTINYYSSHLPKPISIKINSEIKDKCEEFFTSLKSNEFEKAYHELFYKSILYNKKIIKQMVENTSDSLQKYGTFDKYKRSSVLIFDEGLVMLEFITYNEMQPLVWQIYWYKSKNIWRVVDFNVTNNIRILFKDKY